MTDVEKVALWIGLLSGTISIALSLVAIVFAILVDKRAKAVSDQTIKSLQKIESAVERQSDDTRELIKAGWDKMLGTVQAEKESPPAVEGLAKEIASGIVTELRAELTPHDSRDRASTSSSQQMEKLNEMLERLETTIAAQLRVPRPERLSEAFEQAMKALEGLSPTARALAIAITPHHLLSNTYKELMKRGILSDALKELRAPASLFL